MLNDAPGGGRGLLRNLIVGFLNQLGGNQPVFIWFEAELPVPFFEFGPRLLQFWNIDLQLVLIVIELE